MRPKFDFGALLAYWRLRQMKALARSVFSPNRDELNKMLRLLDLTDKKANGWPMHWSPDWYRQLAQSDSWNANNLCCTSAIDHYTQDFVHEMAEYGLVAGNIPLFEWFIRRLDARTLPPRLWARVQQSDPIIQLRFLVKLPHLDELEGDARAPVLSMLAASEPHFWMYDHAFWYTSLSQKWQIVPPVQWWNLLYTLNLRRPTNATRNLVQHYRGKTVNQIFQIMGRVTYSDGILMHHRSEILSQDPWAVVRSAFYGDTQIWPPRPGHDEETHAMYVDAYAILMQYYPQLLQTDFQNSVPESVRQATPRVELMMFLGMASGPEAFEAFSDWLAANDGQLFSSRQPEVFPLDNLL